MLATHLALRWLVRRRAAWLALAAVVTTVTVSIVVMGVMQGFVDVMQRQIRANESDLTMVPGFGQPGLEDSPGYRAFLAEQPQVAHIAPSISGYCMVTPFRSGRESNNIGDNFPALFDAIEWDADQRLQRLPAHTLHRAPVVDLKHPPLPAERRGSGFLTPAWRERLALHGGLLCGGMTPLPLPPTERPPIGAVVGQELAYLNGLLPGSGRHAGSILHMTVPNGRGGVVGKIKVEVSDTIGTGIYEVDRLNCLIPLPQGRRLAGFDSSNGVHLVNAYRIETTATDLDQAAKQLAQATGEPVSSWTERRRHLLKGAVQQRNILGLVMILIQCLAVFILYASFSTLVVEKRRDIGVLLGLGTPTASIALAFILAASLCCVAGGLAGWGLGWGFLAILNPLSDMTGLVLFPQEFMYSPDTPISFDPRVPAIYVTVMTVIGILAVLRPALRAASVDPVETLREGA